MVVTEKYYPVNTFRICADKIEDDVEGRIFTPLKAESISFAGMGDMLVKMDELFDQVGYPQAYQDRRSFDAGKERTNTYKGIPSGERKPEDIINQAGTYKTFDVQVKSRRNTSWQGELYHANGTFIKGFDGEIELLSGIVEAAL